MKPPLRFMFKRNILTFLVVGVSAALFACGENQVEPTPEPIGIEFDKQSVTIDGVTEGRDVSQTFLIMNRGEQVAIVKNVTVLDASECDQVVIPTSSFVVPAGGISIMSVRMQGHRPSTSPHTVSIGVQTERGGATRARLEITLQRVATAVKVQSGPRLGVDHNFTDIGKVPYNVPMHERFEVFNYGDQALHIDGIPLVRTLQGC